MDEQKQIVYMQIRLLRMTATKMNLSLRAVADLFDKYDVLPFIRNGFGIFHVEGDEAVYDEIMDYLQMKGASL